MSVNSKFKNKVKPISGGETNPVAGGDLPLPEGWKRTESGRVLNDKGKFAVWPPSPKGGSDE